MAGVKKTERILNLLALFMKAPGALSWSRIRASVSGYDDGSTAAARRRFERDKKELRALGIELAFDDEHSATPGYRIVSERSLMPGLELDLEEQALLYGLARQLRHTRDGTLRRHLQSALLKLRLESPACGDLDAVEVLPSPRSHPLDPAGALEAIAGAMASSRQVTFAYRSLRPNAPRSRRRVDPHGLFWRDGAWYLVGRDDRSGEMRTFRVDRIEGDVEPAGTAAPPPSGFSLEEEARRPAWGFEVESPYPARARFDADILFMARETGRAREVEEAGDGSGVLTFDVSHTEAFVSWVLSFGRHARVLSPVSLVEAVVARLRAAAENYP